jgi:tetratricopeptide (TPR) repeat protein
MKKLFLLLVLNYSIKSFSQHDHHVDDTKTSTTGHNHLQHMQASRKQNFYIHNLPAPKLMKGIGQSNMTIQTKSDSCQKYFNQGLNLLHDFWDFEAYRAFKEAVRLDSTAIMPYWGLYQMPGPDEDSVLQSQKKNAIKQIKKLLKTANEHDKFYAEITLLADSLKEKSYPEITKKMDYLFHKFPEDVDAKLFLALNKMAGFDIEKKPNEGQMYSEFLLKEAQRIDPNNHGFHHYWIHLMEDCCPERALISADLLTSLAPTSGHIVHMPGHIYNRVGDYKRAHDSFAAAVKTDSTYMKNEGIQEVDNWNYIHNINYLINNSVHDGRHNEALFYAEKLKNMKVDKARKKTYDGTFFNQGILAPAKMEMAFGNWDKAVNQLDKVVNKDSAFSFASMEFKKCLTFFAKGMDALSKNNVNEAIQFSNNLDAILWRIEKQAGKDSSLNQNFDRFSWGYLNTLNTASLELQGCIASLQGDYTNAKLLLKKAEKNEIDLGYGEPPLYARPVAYSIAKMHEKEGNIDKSIETYQALLKRFPKSAMVYFELLKNYRKKGDAEKINEFEMKLKEASAYADKDMYIIDNKQNTNVIEKRKNRKKLVK